MRTVLIVPAALLVGATAGFSAGFWLGSDSYSSGPAGLGGEGAGDLVRVLTIDAFDRLVEERAWAELVERVEELQRGGSQAYASERLRLLELAAVLAGRGEQADSLLLVTDYLALNPRDAPAQLLLADLYEATGRTQDALEPMFTILDFPPDQDSAAHARRRSEELIQEIVRQLVEAGDTAALVDFYRSLVLREPGHDSHRLGLARWMVRDGRYAEAASELKEVGNVGVSEDDLDAVRRDLALAQSELPVTRVGHMLFADLYVADSLVRMLVDTGATRTGMRSDVLRRLGATDLGHSVQVRTAGGVVSARVHRLRELRLGEMHLRQLEVLALDALPGDVEGLLGMDVLSSYPRLAL